MQAMRVLLPIAAISMVGTSAPAADSFKPGPIKPLQFFEGRTEGSGIVRIFLKKTYHTRSVGKGRILPDGSLMLVQRVHDEGKAPHERRWKVRQTGPRRFTGTMSEAVGPVTIDQVGTKYRFRFKMKGNLSVEQWLAPTASGKAANNNMIVRKFGVTVGTSEGSIRKIA